MLRIQIIGLALVSALIMSAVAASSASAAHLWLIGGNLVASPVKIHSLGLVLLTDETAPGGSTAVHCKTFGTRMVGPHALGLMEKITAELLGTNDKVTCSFDKSGACEAGTTPLFLAVNLPWHTELTLLGPELRDMIMPDGAGNPGWSVTCKTLLGSFTDTCTVTLATVKVENVASGVLTLYDSVSNEKPADCKFGTGELRKGVGFVVGDVTLESPSSTEKLTAD